MKYLRLVSFLTLIIAFSSCTEPSKVQQLTHELKFENPVHGFVSENPASRWEESLISGNGTIGLTMPGDALKDRIVFGHERLFMPVFKPYDAPNLGSRLSEIREEIFKGNNFRGAEIMDEEAKKVGIKKWVWTNPPVPACQFEFESLSPDSIQTYARSTNFETGEIFVAYKQNDHIVHRKAFVSRTDGIAVVNFSSPTRGKLNYKFALNQLPVKKASKPKPEFKPENYVDIKIEAGEGFLHYNSKFKNDWEGSVKGQDVVVRIEAPNAEITTKGNWIYINRADEITILADIDVATTKPVNGYQKLRTKLESYKANYGELLAGHVAVHSEIYNRFLFNLGDENEPVLTSEELMASSTFENTNTALVEQLVKAARYNAMSAAGELPPTLQGVWGGTWRPRWSGDYTLNGNVPSAIASGLNTNLNELTDSYLNLMLEMKPAFEYNAKGLYGLNGIYVPSRVSDNGSNYHFVKSCPHLYWNAGTAWAAHFFYDRWLYTQDSVFLKEKAIPFMQDAYTFLSQIIYKTDEGKYMFIPSYSPEIGPKGVNETAINATMDVAAMKQLVRNLITLSEQGFIENASMEEYKNILTNLPEYAIDSNGELKEWIWEGYENQNSHRHASHLYPLFDGIDEDFEQNPELKKAAVQAIESRLKYRRDKNGAIMAFGLVQKGMAAAHLGDTTHAWECMRWLCNSYWTPAQVSYHDPGETFNLDISGGMPAVVSYMLLQSTPKQINLLPCLPGAWKTGSVKGIPARGGFVVDLEWDQGKLTSVSVKSLHGGTTELAYKDWRKEIKLSKGEKIVIK